MVQVVQNKRLWDVPEQEDIRNDQLQLLEVEGGFRVDESIQEDTLCREDVDPTIMEGPTFPPQLRRGVSSNNNDEFIND
ncbi:MAG: hypothetical protein Q8835_02865 [Sweet potato little leaf phytoplasma]|nr:hypothetical protein [Sweet potato little leaf phytoplasma]